MSKHTINVVLPSPPAAVAQAPTIGTDPEGDRIRGSLLRQDIAELRRLRSTAAERLLTAVEEGRLEVLTQDERARNSIIRPRHGKYMFVPLSQIEPYRNRLAE